LRLEIYLEIRYIRCAQTDLRSDISDLIRQMRIYTNLMLCFKLSDTGADDAGRRNTPGADFATHTHTHTHTNTHTHKHTHTYTQTHKHTHTYRDTGQTTAEA
jgi:ABC-type nickel/cobalt efflux system permease component RcnA